MSDAEFGDWEADDSFDGEPADPEQVAVHLHELREWLAANAGDELAAWDALSDDDRQISQALADRLIAALRSNPHQAPMELHEAIAFLSDQPEWDDLDQDAQEVGVGLVDDIMKWLTRQGAI